MPVPEEVIACAKSNVASRYGVDARCLSLAFTWYYESHQLIGFQVNQPGSAYDGSTLSYAILEK